MVASAAAGEPPRDALSWQDLAQTARRPPACGVLAQRVRMAMASCTSAVAPRCVHERCYTTLVFRSNQSASASPVQDAMLQLWLRRMRRFTALPIVVMHANVPSPRRLMNATALRLQLHRVGLLVVDPPGTLPWYKEQYTKLHAWSLPCRQVAYFDYDGFPLRNMDTIFDECGDAPFCAVADTMTPINPKYRGRYFNGGVLVLRPSAITYAHLLSEAEVDARGRRARWYAEQGFLNTHYRNWSHLPAGYNVMGVSVGQRVQPARDYFVHEKFYKLGPRQRRALDLESEGLVSVDVKGRAAAGAGRA